MKRKAKGEREEETTVGSLWNDCEEKHEEEGRRDMQREKVHFSF